MKLYCHGNILWEPAPQPKTMYTHAIWAAVPSVATYKIDDIYIYNIMCVWMDGWMHGCMDAWMHGCMHGWMHGCMHVCMHIYIYISVEIVYRHIMTRFEMHKYAEEVVFEQ